MKPAKLTKLRGVLPLIFLCIVLQSCNVYHKTTYSIDEGIKKEEKVKIRTKSNETFKFNYLKQDENNLIGITKQNSKSAKTLSDAIISNRGDLVGIAIDKKDVEEIKFKNSNASTWVTVGIVAVSSLSALFAFAMSAPGPGN